MTAETDEDPAATVRRTARSVPRAALGTLLRDTGGAPYVSHDGPPLLLSDLADHTRNVAAALVRLARSRLPTASQ